VEIITPFEANCSVWGKTLDLITGRRSKLETALESAGKFFTRDSILLATIVVFR